MKPETKKICIYISIFTSAIIVVPFFIALAISLFISIMIPHEKASEINNPIKLNQNFFSFEYPSNWKIDTEDSDYNPNHFFTIESPGFSHIMFLVEHDNSENKLDINHFLADSKKEISYFDSFGKYKGKGFTSTYNEKGVATIEKIFSFQKDELRILIVSYYPANDSNLVEPGFQLIEKSFQLLDK